jgi:hypothetical protein
LVTGPYTLAQLGFYTKLYRKYTEGWALCGVKIWLFVRIMTTKRLQAQTGAHIEEEGGIAGE